MNTENNVKMKASRVQKHMKKKYDRDIAVVINIGEGLSFRLPGQSCIRLDKKIKVSQALDSIREGTDLNCDESDEDAIPDTDEEGESSKPVISSSDESTDVNNDNPDNDFPFEFEHGIELSGTMLSSRKDVIDMINDESNKTFNPDVEDGSESSMVSSGKEAIDTKNEKSGNVFAPDANGESESSNPMVSSEEYTAGIRVYAGDDTKNKGFSGPIFVFGYSLMRRSISYRGTYDVPTHILLQMGGGHNIENVVQALGRATFIGRELLNKNGFDHVKVLMTKNDFNMARCYQNFVKEVDKRARRGQKVFDAINGTVEELPDEANFLQWTVRRTGMRSKNKPRSFDSMLNPRFENPTSSDIDGDLAKFFADNSNQECYRTAKTCNMLWLKQDAEFETDDIVDAFNDRYKSRHDVDSISKTSVKKHMKAIKRYEIIMEMPMPSSSDMRYSLARHSGRLANILYLAHKLRKEGKTNLKRSAESVTISNVEL